MQPLVNSITPLVQRSSGQEEEVQMKSGLQRASDGSSVASGNVENQLAGSKGGGSALSDDVRSFMEPRFGADFSSVRVHTDSNAVQMNKELGAQAFAHGSDIYYGAGKSPGKDELTAHELTHTVQQTGAVQRSTKRSRDEMELSGQSFTEQPPFNPDAYYSESDSQYESSDESDTESVSSDKKQPTARKKTKRTRAIYNYTKKGQKGKKPQKPKKVDNKAPGGQEGLEAAKSKLNGDAKLIHDVIPKTIIPKKGKNAGKEINNESFGATTITTAILRDTKTGAFKKFVFTNLAGAPSPKIRAQAGELGYHVVASRDSSHAEAQMIQYVDARGTRYELVSQGVDKAHCIECDGAMTKYFGSEYPTQQEKSEKKFKKWHKPRRLEKALGNPPTQEKEPPNKKIKITHKASPKDSKPPQTEVKPPETEAAVQSPMATGAPTEEASTLPINDELENLRLS
jgi:hypothetical protein